jgi:uncharacterized SAM-binding protein YcdF (DUF218 family)
MMVIARTAAGVAGGLALAWVAGFLWFVRDVESPATPAGKADGIVVLTGGAERIATGLHLLQHRRQCRRDGRLGAWQPSAFAHGCHRLLSHAKGAL